MKIPQFGNALFERSAPFHAEPSSTQRLERLKDFQGLPGRQARVLAKRTEKDFYEPSGRMAKNEQALPHVIESATRECELRAEHLDRVRRNSAPPSAFRKAKINLEIAKLKLANARLAQCSSSPNEGQPIINALRATLRRLDDMGYNAGKRLAPAYVHAKANSGAFTLSHDVHDYTKERFEECYAWQDKAFEGMAVAPHLDAFTRNRHIHRMEAELPALQQAIDMASRMKTGSVTHANFVKAAYLNLKAEGHHALSHHYGRYSNNEEFNRQSQHARKAVRQADEILQSIPPGSLTHEHARLGYNLNQKALHLCQNGSAHRLDTDRAQELCAAIKVEDFPHNIQLMKRFPLFDSSYAQDPNIYNPFKD